MDLRSFIGQPQTISELSVEHEIARKLSENLNTLYFSDVEGYHFDVVGNVITSRDDVYRALGTDKDRYIRDVLHAYNNPIETKTADKGPCQEEECSLYDIPLLRHFEGDGGRYITSGVVIANDPEYGRNCSIHRLMLRDDNRLGIRIVPRHLYEYLQRAERRGEDLEVAIAIGVHPIVMFAVSYSPPIGYDELRLAGAFMGKPLEMVKCKTVDCEVPAHSEFVIEGRIPADVREPEGPFADVTGTYDRVRNEPVVEVKKVTHRKNAIYQGLLPASMEHRLLMGMPQEPRIYKSVETVAPVKNVCLTDGGKNWLHGVVSLGDGGWEIKEVVEKSFSGHPSMKHVVIVDDDIDIFNPEEVEFAISTRFQADRDAYVFKNMRGSTLDPSTDKDGKTAKVGIDATMPPERKKDYEFARIP